MQLIHTRLRGKRLAKNAESVQEGIVREREQQAPEQMRLLQQRRGQTKGLLKNPTDKVATKLFVFVSRKSRGWKMQRHSAEISASRGAATRMAQCRACVRVWPPDGGSSCAFVTVQAGQDKLTRMDVLVDKGRANCTIHVQELFTHVAFICAWGRILVFIYFMYIDFQLLVSDFL